MYPHAVLFIPIKSNTETMPCKIYVHFYGILWLYRFLYAIL
ncbi:hypothetical protein HMPREF9136_2394 [Prevotella dentalis DSM 3688]|uniref:Uncharacterized protein n=1 Tax=Prevotella dentalis (strain ATCC 49559 / DSM 3688 / JCM 13448 / NCTC 12043 / ES 2772) TaxID=908937 RepID=F9D6B6_PREDD|nr:hypothetical protein HMPREF9136_2394 [Prevotella dentalis DSM 3688]